jgi:hypothetical protein
MNNSCGIIIFVIDEIKMENKYEGSRLGEA